MLHTHGDVELRIGGVKCLQSEVENAEFSDTPKTSGPTIIKHEKQEKGLNIFASKLTV